ncbi:MAG: hypothetical protein HND56_05250 [Pseudomonadota bacterium]|nr:hypothetical protein [Pseudomonadota bacterium]QKK05129.1 MAG: hypothetical protein HND56_05250 [Pseudomonadota bacterium]
MATKNKSWEYQSSIHNWDMTLEMAQQLTVVGKVSAQGSLNLGDVLDERSKGNGLVNTNGLRFGLLTGGMLLSYCAVESFINSAAEMLTGYESFPDFDRDGFNKESGFWSRLKKVYKHVGIEVDKGKEPFQSILELHEWRKSVVHAKPVMVSAENIDPSDREVLHRLHESQSNKDFLREVNENAAGRFYEAAYDVIHMFIDTTNLKPITSAIYTPQGK